MSGSGSDDKRPSRVLEHLFIGSRVHAKNRGLLKELGINRILNVTPARTMDPTNGVPNFFEKDRSMTYKRVAVFDNRGEDLLQHLEPCISFIEQGSFYGKVLVHCNKGVSRSSTVVAAYLMRTRGLSKTAAMTYLRSRRSIVNPHEGFMAQLETFDVKLNSEREAAIADGQEKKFPDDLLGNAGRKAAQGPAIGPIGPPRGPAAAAPTPALPNAPRSTSPMRRPAGKPSPPRGCSTTTAGAKKNPPGQEEGGAPSNSPPRVRAGLIGPSRGPEPAPRQNAAGAAVGPRPGPAGGGGEGGVDCTLPTQEAAGAEIASTAAPPANGSASKTPPPAAASVSASIGPSAGPPLRPDARRAEGEASTAAGGEVDGAQGAAGADSGDGVGGDGLRSSVGDKRARETEIATDLAETLVQKPRVAVSGDGEKA